MKIDSLMNELKEQKILIVGVIAAGLIFGFVVGRTFKGREAGEVTKTEQKESEKKNVVSIDVTPKKGETIKTSVIAPVVKTSNLSSVSVDAKLAAGKSVFVKNVSLKNDSWIVVREDLNGSMGNVLGASWLPKGTTGATTVELLRGTEAGRKYYVVLWSDNGDQIFGMDTDKPLTNNGQMISSTFTAQ